MSARRGYAGCGRSESGWRPQGNTPVARSPCRSGLFRLWGIGTLPVQAPWHLTGLPAAPLASKGGVP